MANGQQPVGLWPSGTLPPVSWSPGAAFRCDGARPHLPGTVGPFPTVLPSVPLRPRAPPALLAYMVTTHGLIRRAIRWLPNWAFCLFVLEDTSHVPVGFATIRFVRDDQEPEVWARFGFLVSEGRQRQGGGTLLVMALYEKAMELGIRRGGGTILAANIASAKVVQQFGFNLHETPEVDRFAPNDRNLADIQDLGPVLERSARLKELRVAASGPREGEHPPAARPPSPDRPSSRLRRSLEERLRDADHVAHVVLGHRVPNRSERARSNCPVHHGARVVAEPLDEVAGCRCTGGHGILVSTPCALR